jgi:uncharacterized protein
MTTRFQRWATQLSGCLLLILLSACTGLGGPSPPNHYYVLTSVGSPPAGSGSPQQGPLIAVSPVALPAYLDQPGITTRGAGNEVIRADFDRWAGALGSEITRVVGENLSIMVPTDRLTVSSTGRSLPVDFLVEIEITSFERDQSNAVQLVARWTLFAGDGNTILAMRTSRITQPTAGSDYNSDVAAMSNALEELCRQIASAIQEGGPPAQTGKPARKASK